MRRHEEEYWKIRVCAMWTHKKGYFKKEINNYKINYCKIDQMKNNCFINSTEDMEGLNYLQELVTVAFRVNWRHKSEKSDFLLLCIILSLMAKRELEWELEGDI